MVDEILSQEEIDKLLNVPGLGPGGGVELDAKELERVTGVVKPVFKTAGSTFGPATDRKVKVTGGTKGALVSPSTIDTEASVLLRAPFRAGFTGELLFYLPLSSATAVSDLALGGDGESNTSLDNADRKILKEMFEHLLGDATSAITTAIDVEVDFDALTIEAVDKGELSGSITVNGEDIFSCKGNLKVNGIADAPLYVLFTGAMAASIVYTLTPFKPVKRSGKSKAATKPTKPSPSAPSADVETLAELRNIDLIMQLEVEVMIRLGNAKMPLKDIQRLHPGSIIDLDRTTEAPVELVVNDCVIAHGELVVTSSDNFALRVTQVQTPKERIRSLGSQ